MILTLVILGVVAGYLITAYAISPPLARTAVKNDWPTWVAVVIAVVCYAALIFIFTGIILTLWG